MIGPITDSCALFVGGLAGTLFSGFIPKRVKETLPLIFGVITLCMGSTLVNKASALPVVVMALIVGSVIGELVFAESFLVLSNGKGTAFYGRIPSLKGGMGP